MNTLPPHDPTALDELIRLAPGTDTAAVEQARRAADLLRGLGLLSTEPSGVISPFTRHPSVPPPPPGWTVARTIRFDPATN
jgi:hypothetical protein